MALGPHVAEWNALVAVLDELAERTGASNACVTDAWGHLWCRARPLTPLGRDRVLDLAREVVEHAPRSLARGGRIDRGADGAEGGWYARSFAGVYVALLVFDGRYDPLAVRRTVADLLPRIEASTLALPPPDGPTATSGAAKQRA